MHTRFFKRKQTEPAPSSSSNGHDALIRINHITKKYKTGAEEVTVLKGINAEFYKGEFVGIIGRSGSGKSTLVNMITGIDRPTSGEVFVGDTAVHELSEGQMSVWRGRNLGIVFQFFQLLPMLSLLENIMLPMDFCNMYTRRQRKERAMYLLELVEMKDHANKLPTAISGGQQQRVAIARALANDPPIILADEPTGNLDSKTADAVFKLFEDLVKQGKTIVMVTHDSSLARRVSRTLLIADGEVVNEWVMKTLPTLTHSQMLAASKKLQKIEFAPGQQIIEEGRAQDRFYILTDGFADVSLKRPGGTDVFVTRMGTGQYFGEISLLHDQNASATVHAAETGAKVLALDHATFDNLMEESEVTRESIEQMADQREDTNEAARNGNGA